ncbi:MAG: bifunctional hydroxymethylpyrimidine kinase/phosphomethylpyrimidine kinase [Clostridia bacterium]|nr:bifunctional hydroxymethylpyrimidine kinase/phosphomethylpyrimidine kinase [Clostridia bacterium]
MTHLHADRLQAKVPAVLTVAGSDCSGGAGIQADLKTMTVLGCYGMSVITAITAQNTTGVQLAFETPPDMIAAQLDSVFADIFPDAVKCGMFASPEAVRITAGKFKEYGAKNIVADPVMASTSGSTLTCSAAVQEMKESLFPLAAIITPNIQEAEVLSGACIRSPEDMEKAALGLSKEYGCAVLVKGGHFETSSNDCLAYEGAAVWLKHAKIYNPNTHGTGCTLSSAIASYLAMGEDLVSSVCKAKEYLTGAISYGLQLGHGRGPLYHAYTIRRS